MVFFLEFALALSTNIPLRYFSPVDSYLLSFLPTDVSYSVTPQKLSPSVAGFIITWIAHHSIRELMSDFPILVPVTEAIFAYSTSLS